MDANLSIDWEHSLYIWKNALSHAIYPAYDQAERRLRAMVEPCDRGMNRRKKRIEGGKHMNEMKHDQQYASTVPWVSIHLSHLYPYHGRMASAYHGRQLYS